MIIGLIGQKRVGKDTVANIIQEYDKEYKRFALADPIKDIARIMFNFSEEQLFESEKDQVDGKWGIKPRDFFEKFGTEIMQYDIYKYLPALESHVPQRSFWVKSLINKINKIESDNPKVIITDIRGYHELNEIKKHYSRTLFIKITRPDKQLQNISNTHLTQLEPELISNKDYDEEIINSGSIAELKEKIYSLLDKYRKE